MANKNIFGLPEKKKRQDYTVEVQRDEFGRETGRKRIPADEKPAEEKLMAKVKKYDRAIPSVRGDMFGVTRLPAGPEKTVELTPASEEDVFGTPKKKKEE